MGVIPMGEHYKSIFLSVIILADKFTFVEIVKLNITTPEGGFPKYTKEMMITEDRISAILNLNRIV